MAPQTSDPSHLRVLLNPARRKALLTLITEITAYMRQQFVLQPTASSSRQQPSSSGDAPLFHQPPSRSRTSSSTQDRDTQSSPPSTTTTPYSPQLLRIRQFRLAHFDAWRLDLISKLKTILNAPDDNQILTARRVRQEKLATSPGLGENLIDFGSTQQTPTEDEDKRAREEAVERLQALYHAIPTRLTTIPAQDRLEILSAFLLLLLSTGTYTAESRTVAVYLCSALSLPLSDLVQEELEIAVGLVQGADKAGKEGMSADAEAAKRKEANKVSRYWKVGLASVAGAAVIGVTGGLAAPVVAGAIGGLMGSVGLGGVASFLGIFWMNGALVGTLFGAMGARMTGEIVDQYARSVRDFRFIPLLAEYGALSPPSPSPSSPTQRLRLTIGINGWLTSKSDITKPFRSLGSSSAEVFCLRYEMDVLLTLGQSLQGLVTSHLWSAVKMELLKRTVLATLWSTLWPAYMLSVASSIDNPFSLAKNRSEKAGEILADALINKVQGERPVTLIGYSLGARVIYSCLRTLAERNAFGLVENVVFIGAPIPSNRNHWEVMRSVVSGKLFNVFSENDYILAFLYRATSIQLGIAGLQAIKDIEGVENLDLTEEVQGHLRYADIIGSILVRTGLFTDIVGADGNIEKEDDAIGLRDADLGRTGTLIELDDLPQQPQQKPVTAPRRVGTPEQTVTKGPEPKPRTPEQMRARFSVSRAKSEAIVVDQNPLGSPDEPPSDAVAPLRLVKQTPEVTKFADEPTPTEEKGNVKYFGTFQHVASGKKASSPGLPTHSQSMPHHGLPNQRSQVDGVEDDSSDKEEDTYVGIRMENNDNEDFAYVEHIPLED